MNFKITLLPRGEGRHIGGVSGSLEGVEQWPELNILRMSSTYMPSSGKGLSM